jgi:hypothetical protein
MENLFCKKHAWHGGFYELSLEMGQLPDEELDAALKAIWSFPDLSGCYLRRDIEPSLQAKVTPDIKFLLAGSHLLGIATLPTREQVACGTFLVRGDKWLGFYLPMGTLEGVGAYPFGPDGSSRRWREPLDNWLAKMGQSVFAKVPFLLGLVGFEVSGSTTSSEVKVAGVPAERFMGYLYPTHGKLSWFPTNQWQHQPQPAS